MPIPNPSHLLDQAEELIAAPAHGPPRQVYLRRAISTAYYGLFHFTSIELSDEFVGKLFRASRRYSLVYRSVDHRPLRDLCSEVVRRTPSRKYADTRPNGGFGDDLNVFSEAVIVLQQDRHSADYDPGVRYKTSDARQSVETSRRAIERFAAADQDQRKMFLTLLLCPPR